MIRMFKLLRYGALALAMFLAQSGLQAQTKVMSLSDAVKYSIDHSSSTRTSQLTVAKANSAVDEYYGYAYPSVDLTAGFNRFISKSQIPFVNFSAMLNNATYGVLFNENVIPTDNSKLQDMSPTMMSMAQYNNYSAKLQVNQVLFSSAVFTGIGASKIYLDLSKEQFRGTTMKDITSIKKAFYAVILCKEQLKIIRESLVNAEENLANLRSLYKQGLTSEYQVMQVEVQVENIRPQIKQLENALEGAKNGMKILLGMDMAEEVDFTGELTTDVEEISDYQSVISNAYNNNYDLRTLNKKTEVDAASIDISKADYYPTLSAFGYINFAGSSDKWDFNSYTESMVGISFSMNLFNGNRTKNKLQQSYIEQETTKEQIALLKSSIDNSIRAQVLEIQRVKTSLEAQRRNVALAQKAYDISTSQFEQGTGTQLEIKNADLELRSAKTNLLQSAYDYMTACAELDQLTGTMEPEYQEMLEKKIADSIKK